MTGSVTVVETPNEVAHVAAELFATTARAVLADRSLFRVALAGGTTPRDMYKLLSTPTYRERVEWPRVEIFFTDERCVPPDHADSNYRMARESLLDHVPLAADHVHRIPGERTPAEAAEAYQSIMKRVLGADDPPHLDMVLLGMGKDGHTASLFPETPVLDERKSWCAPVYLEAKGVARVTMTLPVLCNASHVLVLVTGEDKAETLQQALGDRVMYPIQSVRPQSGQMTWLVDRAAASKWNPDL